MPYPFPSGAWAQAFMEKLNASPTYADIARNWEGDICFVIEPDSDGSVAAMTLYMDLWHGRCRAARVLADPSEAPAAFVLAAGLSVYVQILKGRLDPIQAMLTRRLRVTGDMIKLVRNVPTVLEFVRTATQVDAVFPQ
jgi:putative sterol carrier protein